jgi:hypothetical protein
MPASRVLLLLTVALAAPSAFAEDGGAPQFDLTGDWVFGVGTPEPSAGPVKLPQRCWEGGEDVQLRQRGARVTGTRQVIPKASGVRPMYTLQESEELSGVFEGTGLTLQGKYARVLTPEVPGTPPSTQPEVHHTYRYRLRYDPATRHLVGTRDGKPFWAAPLIHTKRSCGSPPP